MSRRATCLPVLVLVASGACAGGGGQVAAGGCDPVVREPLDPRSTQHLLPGAPEPAYASDPPTSGPHQSGARASGVLDTPLPRPVQVAVLEEGGVLLQHRDLSETDRRRLAALAGDHVVIAPNPDLPAPVVATAWRHRLQCTRVDAARLEAFVEAHRGKGAAR